MLMIPDEIRCLCKNCMNSVQMLNCEISPSYCQWVYHGKLVNLSICFERVTKHSTQNDEETSNNF